MILSYFPVTFLLTIIAFSQISLHHSLDFLLPILIFIEEVNYNIFQVIFWEYRKDY